MASKQLIRVFCLLILFFVCSFLAQADIGDKWELLYKPKQRVVKSIGLIDDSIFIGTTNGVFLSKDKGGSWIDFGNAHLPRDLNGNLNINWIHISKEEKNIYIATGYGAFYSSVTEPKWTSVFNLSKTEDLKVNSLALHDDKTYFGTQDGLWECDLLGINCIRSNKGIRTDPISGDLSVSSVLSHAGSLYITSVSGVYKYNNESNSWNSINSNLQFLPNGQLDARHLFVDFGGRLWLASGTGVYYSDNEGNSWTKYDKGISGDINGFISANFIASNNESICVGLKDGLYCKESDSKDNWQNLSFGLKTKNELKQVYWISFDKTIAYVGTDEGLYIRSFIKSNHSDIPFLLKGQVESDFTNLEALEPTVVEVQKKALGFAALPSDFDYKKYNWLARLRNLVPRVALDLNSTGTTTDLLQFNKSISTDVSLNNEFDADRIFKQEYGGKAFQQLSLLWGANNLIYDDAVVNLLNHARLTANVRENISDDVTRIYYQRRGLQLETLLNPPELTGAKLSRQLEIATLTGQLDSRTGGWFSGEIEKRKRKLGIQNNG